MTEEKPVKRRPIELRWAYDQKDGSVLVQTGIYLFNTSTLQDVYDLAKRSSSCPVPDFVELHLAQFEEEDEDGE